MYRIGVDEAGRGPAIGPLVVCALGVPEEDIEVLSDIGAKDSKSMSKKKRMELASEIYSEAEKRRWKIGLISCSASRIDQERIRTNLNKLEVELFKEAILATDIKKNLGEILLDACDIDEQRFGNNVHNNLGKKWEKWTVKSKHKMDSDNIIVGAASILAKVQRDSEISQIGKSLNLEIGSGYPSDPKTKIAIKELVSGEYPNRYLRWSWKTVERIWFEVNNRPMPNRDESNGNSKQSSLNDW